MKFYLIGFMGSGKTTLGKKYATRIQYDFIDLDDFIQRKSGKSIRNIFEKMGEKTFRTMEAENLRLLEKIDNTIISVGGGTPCFHRNMDWMNKTGYTVYLKQSPEFLFTRLKNAKSKRPLISGLTDTELLEFIKSSLDKREPFYNQASLVVDTKDIKVKKFDEIMRSSLKVGF